MWPTAGSVDRPFDGCELIFSEIEIALDDICMRKSNAKHEPAKDATGATATYLSADERRAAGKALHDATPRAAHGGWKPKDRRDPVELLRESNEGRIRELIPIRFSRMAQSPFAFYRGAAAIMAADLASTPTSGLRVQACGDAHLMNFGGFATPERNIFFDINDFDETLPALDRPIADGALIFLKDADTASPPHGGPHKPGL
jgi:Uncharacterized protein conserved in bacteria (DUF2252)